MTVLAVTAATGQLGRLVIAALLESGIAPADVVAIARDPAKASDLAAAGVTVRTGDYAQAADWPAALAGVDRLLLVSGTELGQRVRQHATVVDAAKQAGISRIVYTSAPRADTSALILAPEHKATEELVRASGLPFTILRNGWYIENWFPHLPLYLAQGAIVGASGSGRLSAAARADFAAAAAVALMSDAPEFETGTAFELGGSPSVTLAEVAAAITEVTGTTVEYRDLSPADHTAFLISTGMDEGSAAFVTALEEATARGDLETNTDDLQRLIGRPSTPLVEVLRAR